MMDFFGHITSSGIGYNSKGIQFFYPLTPKLCLVFEDALTYNIYEDVFIGDYKFVEFVNARLIQNSKQWIYSQNNDFIFANEYLQEYPHFKNADILFGLWKIPENDFERVVWEQFYGKEAKRKFKNYLDHLIRNGATEQEIEKIQIKYDLEYKEALEKENHN